MRWAAEIKVGEHVASTKILGLTVSLDIVWSSLIAAAIVLGLGFAVRRNVTKGVPGRLQLAYETIVEQIQDVTDSAIGPQGRRFVPVALMIFLFTLVCNWLEVLPNTGEDWVPAPTGDVNLPLAMALMVIVWVHVESIRARGIKGYLGHYAQPYKALIPINIIEEITKPITLTFRLFGNIFSGGLMIVVMSSLLPFYASFLGQMIWKPFDMAIGLIQAFIFALLTILYFGMAMSHEEH
ncbi:MAG: F0F1 ATP synthase subunit A [Actinomycetes bacterium]|jgi:F-type H+-transporting ATPase subunit a